MIDTSQAILLGVLQGLTEFIPISSTAHLRVIPALLHQQDPGAAYSAVIQLGTLISLLIYFREELVRFAMASLKGLLSGKPFENEDAKMLYYMAVGTIPISVIGLLFSDFITGDARSLYVVASALIGLGVILWLTDAFAAKIHPTDNLNWKDALYIGLAQCLALIPGASRAGTTLTMGLLLRYTREASMRISFLLSIPAIALSGLYELFQEREHLSELGLDGLLIGTVVSAVVGYATIAGLLRFLRSHSTVTFALYRVALGALLFFLLHSRIIQPL